MQIIDPGHTYKLFQLDNISNDINGFLRFVKRQGSQYPGNTSSYAGTNIQDVLRCLIDRVIYLNNQIPNWRNKICLWCFKLAFNMLEWRAAKRHKRKFKFIWNIEKLPFSSDDGHCRF